MSEFAKLFNDNTTGEGGIREARIHAIMEMFEMEPKHAIALEDSTFTAIQQCMNVIGEAIDKQADNQTLQAVMLAFIPQQVRQNLDAMLNMVVHVGDLTIMAKAPLKVFNESGTSCDCPNCQLKRAMSVVMHHADMQEDINANVPQG